MSMRPASLVSETLQGGQARASRRRGFLTTAISHLADAGAATVERRGDGAQRGEKDLIAAGMGMWNRRAVSKNSGADRPSRSETSRARRRATSHHPQASPDAPRSVRP
jgi:hypothetical protein